MSYLYNPIIIASILFIAGHIFGWFSGNAQLVWDFWKNKPIISTVIFGIPGGILFWYGTKIAYDELESLWSIRFLVASLSYLIFPLLTWYFMGETIFTLKTMICIALSLSILAVQYYL